MTIMRNGTLEIALDNLARRDLNLPAVGKGCDLRYTLSNTDGVIVLADATPLEVIAYARESAKRSILAGWDAEQPLRSTACELVFTV